MTQSYALAHLDPALWHHAEEDIDIQEAELALRRLSCDALRESNDIRRCLSCFSSHVQHEVSKGPERPRKGMVMQQEPIDAPTTQPEPEIATVASGREHAREGRRAEPEAERPAVSGPMRVLESRVYRGPNPYGYRPVVRFKLDLGPLEEYPTTRLGDFTDRLLEMLPSLQSHGCSYGEPGGLVRRMHEGTWLGHVTEHVAMELQTLAGTQVTYGKTRSTGEDPGVYNVIYSYLEEQVGLLAGWMALRLVDSLLPPQFQGVQGLEKMLPRDAAPLAPAQAPFDFKAELNALVRLAERRALGPTTQSLVDEAKWRGIPAIRLDNQSLVQLGYGKYQQRIRASITSQTSHLGVETASDKALTSQLLEATGLPVPRSMTVRSPEEAVAAAARLGFPLVTKPLDASHGRGVSLNLLTPEQVRWGYEQAREYGPSVMVEQFMSGYDYRVLVVNYEVVAVAQRVPAHVKGDGGHTIQELIDIINQDPRRGLGHEKVMTRITIDAQANRLLAQAGYTLDTVLPEGELFYLRSTANMSTGGTSIDVTDRVHPDNLEICRRAARVIGLDLAGIDIISPDITQSLCDTGGGIVEINAGPGFRMHLQPSEGKRRNVARPVIDMLFPRDVPCCIPIVAITGTNGKTTTSRMVAHILKTHGKRVGLTTSTGIYIDGELYLSGDTTGPKSAQMVLRDATIEVAVLETARGGILREGLGFDRCQVGAVLNIQSDHLGTKGVDTLRDLAWIKSLVVEVVEDDGHSVLNADDPLTVRMRRRAAGNIIFFSMHGGEDSPEHLREHIARGGKAVVFQPAVKGGMLAVYDGEQYLPLMWAHEIPATLEGTARFNIENALAAAAIAYGLNIPISVIRKALGSFATTFEENPGRLNIYDGLPFRVILDYAHNPHGLGQIADLVKRIRPRYKRVLAVITGTGDRRDQDVRECGEIVGRMADEIIVKETTLLRGRRAGEIPRLVHEGVVAAGVGEEHIHFVEQECEAVRTLLEMAQPGDLVLVFCDDYKNCWKTITAFPKGTCD
jgi:cyanophycin synthetase